MDFGEAIKALKDGQRVRRAGWDGKGMWLALMPGLDLPADKVNERTRRFVPEGPIYVGPYIVMWTAQNVWQPGWMASQPDMLSEDWEAVPESA